MHIDAHHAKALDRSITPTRMSSYLKAVNGNADPARELYLWDRDLAVAFLSDLDMPLDDRSMTTLSTAWGRIKEPKTSGKLVAQCMFGF